MFSLFRGKSIKDIKVEEPQLIKEVAPIKSKTSCGVSRKEHLMAKMSDKIGADEKDIIIVYEALVKIVEEELAHHGEIRLSGLGKLITKAIKAREYYNIKTKRKYMGKDRQVVRFRPAYNLRNAVEEAAKLKAEGAAKKAHKKSKKCFK